MSISSAFGSTEVEASARGFAGYAVASYDKLPVENLVPYARLGLAYTSVDASASSGNVSMSGSGSDFDLAYSLGLRYNVNDRMSALVDITSTGVDVMSVGVAYSY